MANEPLENQKSKIKNRIDWQEVKDRLSRSEAALEKALVVDPQRILEVFRQRAAQLAGRRAVAAPTTNKLPVLVFTLGAERYGLELGSIAEVFPFVKCTSVPTAPRELLGVINVRGDVRSVVDLSRMLELPEAEERPTGYVLLLHQRDVDVGLRVDRVEKIELVSPEALITPDSQAGNLPTRYAKGLTADRLIVLDVNDILAHPLFTASLAQ